jgi:hypothetical protein
MQARLFCSNGLGCSFSGMGQASKGAALYVGSFGPEYPMVSLANKCGVSTCVTVVNTAFWHNQASWGGAVFVDDAPRQCSHDGGAKFECSNTAWVS